MGGQFKFLNKSSSISSVDRKLKHSNRVNYAVQFKELVARLEPKCMYET